MKKILLAISLLWISFTTHAQDGPPLTLDPYFSAIIVTDINASIDWYSNILGFTVLNKVESEARGFKQSNLERGNILLELIELEVAVDATDVVPNYNDKTRLIGFFKCGFLVTDFDKWMAYLTEQKVNFHGTAVTDPISGKRIVIVKDPDGNRIQLFEK